MVRFVTGLVLSLAVAVSSGRSADAELTPKQVAEIWDRLGSYEPALDDIGRLVHSPAVVVPFLKKQLQPVPAPDRKRVEQYLADLDSKNFRQRENAAKELEALGQLAGPAVEAKLREKLPLEVRRRLESIQVQLNHGRWSAQEMRTSRGIDVLRGIGSKEAVAVLEELARGADGAVQTVQARQVLADLGRTKR